MPDHTTRISHGTRARLAGLRWAARILGAAGVAAFLLSLGSCSKANGPAPIAVGKPCANCGMAVNDRRFACELKIDRTWLQYDAIECLLADTSRTAPAWLADYDTQSLHAAESLWVVQGDLPSPMGGGYAAFLDRTVADEIATARRGRVARLGDFRGPRTGATP